MTPMITAEMSWSRRASLGLAAALVAFAIVAGAREAGLLQSSELRVYDAVKSFSVVHQPASDVVIVPITDTDISAWGWPVTDARLATLINTIADAGPLAIGLDIYRDRPVGDGWDELQSAFSKGKAVAISKLPGPDSTAISPPSFVLESKAYGFSDVPIDADGIARRALLLVADEAGVEISFALRLALDALGMDGPEAWPSDPRVLRFGDQPVAQIKSGFGSYRQLDDSGYQILVAFSQAIPVARSVPASDIISGHADMSLITDKVVIVGTASSTIKDNFLTPLNRFQADRSMFGIQLHAAVVQQLLDYSRGISRPVRSPNSSLQNTTILAAALMGGVIAMLPGQPLVALGSALALALLSGAGMAAATASGLWLPALPSAVGLAGAALSAFGFRALIDRRRYHEVTRLFASHVSPSLADEVWRNRDVILNGGKPVPMRLFATVLFADLSGSTAVGGTTDPQAYMNWVGDFLDSMGKVADEHGGFVEKFTGDGILVVFGAPLPSLSLDMQRRDAEAACACALSMVSRAVELSAKEGVLAVYRMRIGLHSGEVFGGTIGTTGALRYNVMGNTVNVASRIEAYGKRVQDRQKGLCPIHLSSVTAILARGVADVRKAGELLHDDGKTTIQVYELVGLKAERERS